MTLLKYQVASILFLLAVLVPPQCHAFSPSTTFTLVNNSRSRGAFLTSHVGASSTETRFYTRMFAEPPTKKKMTTNEIIGIDRGLYLIAIVMFINVWIFSIPPEFRRAKICSEEQVIQYPTSGCMTGTTWVEGVKDYYAKGGGISFDFTIEKKSQPQWMGGEQPLQK